MPIDCVRATLPFPGSGEPPKDFSFANHAENVSICDEFTIDLATLLSGDIVGTPVFTITSTYFGSISQSGAGGKDLSYGVSGVDRGNVAINVSVLCDGETETATITLTTDKQRTETAPECTKPTRPVDVSGWSVGSLFNGFTTQQAADFNCWMKNDAPIQPNNTWDGQVNHQWGVDDAERWRFPVNTNATGVHHCATENGKLLMFINASSPNDRTRVIPFGDASVYPFGGQPYLSRGRRYFFRSCVDLMTGFSITELNAYRSAGLAWINLCEMWATNIIGIMTTMIRPDIGSSTGWSLIMEIRNHTGTGPPATGGAVTEVAEFRQDYTGPDCFCFDYEFVINPTGNGLMNFWINGTQHMAYTGPFGYQHSNQGTDALAIPHSNLYIGGRQGIGQTGLLQALHCQELFMQ